MIRRLVLAAAAMAFAQARSPRALRRSCRPRRPSRKSCGCSRSPDYFDTQALEEFERASGYQVAYDAYDGPADVADKWREGPYDLVVLSGPTLAREIALGALSKLDKSRIPNARAIQPLVAAKLAAYDPGGAYALPVGWFATGLLYDADKAAKRLGGPPVSWASLFVAAEARKMADCGIVLPDARDALFVAAWRTLGVDPARATALAIKSAGALIDRAATGRARVPGARRRRRAGERRGVHLPSATPAKRKPRARAAARAARRWTSASLCPGRAARCRSTPSPFRATRRIRTRPTRCSISCCGRTSPPVTRAPPAWSARSTRVRTRA